ncbi:hypothetical protein [Salinirubrum litoreum]|uniref:Uncharacterized protein n=1 Tax=Salinirubrum litoreum TaxID=1126234 RepID=A0ABD5R9P4_9EURY|nr:hypothetical protein [Salinirubrum litoreum]
MSVIDRLRRPEYVGANRCWPCTILNLGIVCIVGVSLTLVSLPVALLVVVVGAVLVALRGYVVPYTPEFAPRLVAYLPVEFGPEKATDGGRTSESIADDEMDGERLLGALFEAGVLVGQQDLAPAADFLDDWEAEMAELRDLSDDDLASAVAARVPGAYTGRMEDGWLHLDSGEESILLSRTFAIAEGAAVAVLTDWGVDRKIAVAAAQPLRMFAETCPACGGRVVETTVGACCGGTSGVYDSPETAVLACADCDERLFTFEDDPVTG